MRYYFDLAGEGSSIKDNDGLECSSIAQMRAKAMSILGEIAADIEPADNRIRLLMNVRDAQGAPVYTASLLIEGNEVTG